MGNAELIKALRCKEYFDLCKDTSCKYYVGDMRSGCHCEIKVKEYASADALEMADAKLHEQDLRIADLVAHLNAEQVRVARLVEENEKLKAENCNMRENSVSHEVYMRVCAERDVAIADITDMGKSLPRGVGCYHCKHYTPAGGDGECENCNFELCGRKEPEEIER